MFGLEPLIFVGRVLLVMCAVAVTSFPVLYTRSPWYRSTLGRMVMMQSVTICFAINLKLILTFFFDDTTRTALLVVNCLILFLITTTSAALTYQLWYLQHHDHEGAAR